MKSSFQFRKRGFALLEVLIAVVVLATGLLALTALQGALTRASADSKARSQVAAYAASEMDRIRMDGVVGDKSATAGGTDAISLAARAGGLSGLTQTACDITYSADASGNFTTADTDCARNPPASGAVAYFFRNTLTLSWTDATGGTRALSVSSDISPLALTSNNVLVDRPPPGALGLRPIVRRESPVTEGMIPIATGGEDSEQTAATNPKPKLLGGDDGSYVSDTRFDVLTYSSDAPENFARFNKRIETAVVGCTCQNSTAGFTGNGPGAALRAFNLAQGYRPTYWSGTAYRTPEIATAAVSTSPADVPQSALCDICCRDHKDPVGETGPKFSPWPGQTAAHYRVDGTGAFVVAAANETYLEACRVIRVDGVFRVSADPKIQDNALIATQVYPSTDTAGSQLAGVLNNNAATSPALSTAGKSGYVDYVYGAVARLFFDATAVAGTGNAVDYAALQASSLNVPSYVPILPTADRRWLHSRIVMTDYLESDAQQRVVTASQDCEAPASDADKAHCVLPYIPMATINTTEIATWSPRASTDADARPANLASLAAKYFNFARSVIRRFNSALALFDSINPTDASSPAVDEQLFVQLAATEPTQPVWLNTPSPNPSTARFFGNPLNPMRGYAQTSAPLSFKLSWNFPSGNPASPVSGSATGDDPTASVTNSGICSPNTSANNTTNPHTCNAPGTTGVEISLAGYNRIQYSDVKDDCAGGNAKTSKPTCVIYTFTGATVDQPNGTVAAASATVVDPAKTGKVGEIIRFTLPSLSNAAANPSTVTASFSRTTTDATSSCDTNTKKITWTIPCQ